MVSYIVNTLLYTERPVLEVDNMLVNLFGKHKLICPQLFNFNFVFDLEDFLSQMKQIKKLGPLENLIKLLPGAKKMGLNNVQIDPKQTAHIEAIILSMTPEERHDPSIIKASRKQRIANGCGMNVSDVNKLLNQFEEMKKMMKMIGNNKNFKLPF